VWKVKKIIKPRVLMQPVPWKTVPQLDPADCFIEPKLCGWRCQALKLTSSHIFLCSRKPETFSRNWAPKVPHIAKILLEVLPPETHLDGELVFFERTAGGAQLPHKLQSVLGRKEVADASLLRHVVYVVFDVLFFAGKDLREKPLVERRDPLLELFFFPGPGPIPNIWFRHLPLAPGPIRIVPFKEITDRKMLEKLLADFKELGAEGAVLKKRDSPYVEGPSSYWAKVKF